MQNTKDSLYVGEEYWKQHIDELVTKNQWKRLLTATFILELLLESDSYGNKLEKDIHARTISGVTSYGRTRFRKESVGQPG